MMIVGANFLAAGYRGSRTAFDVALSVVVFVGMGLFLGLAAPIMLFGTVGGFPPSRVAALGIGVALAFAIRMLPVTRLYSCLTQGFWMLAATAYLERGGDVQLLPGPLMLVALGVAGAVVVGVVEGVLSALGPRVVTRVSIAVAPLLVALAIAPYAGWLRAANGP